MNRILAEFNALRLAPDPDGTWVPRLDRLAQAAFRAGHHLIVYGSLSPGAPNHHRLAALNGKWEDGWVEGDRVQLGWGAELGFPALSWRPGGARVAAHLLRSAALADRWTELDRFEGEAYRRILVPFHSELGISAIGYLYAAAPT